MKLLLSVCALLFAKSAFADNSDLNYVLNKRCSDDGISFDVNFNNAYIKQYFSCARSDDAFCQERAAGGIVLPYNLWDGKHTIPTDALKSGCAQVIGQDPSVKMNYDSCGVKVVRGYPSNFNYVNAKLIFLPNVYILGVLQLDPTSWVDYTFDVQCDYQPNVAVNATLDNDKGEGQQLLGAPIEYRFLDGFGQPITGPVALGSEVIYDIKVGPNRKFHSIIPQSCYFSTSGKAGDKTALTIPFIINSCPHANGLQNLMLRSEYVGSDPTSVTEYQIRFKLFKMSHDATALYVHCDVALCITENEDCVPNGTNKQFCAANQAWTQAKKSTVTTQPGGFVAMPQKNQLSVGLSFA